MSFCSFDRLAIIFASTMTLLSACTGLAAAATTPTPTTTLLPLSVVNDQVVDSKGNIFQFRCANWVGHMESNLPEGLQHQSLSHIVDTIASSGTINCVRLNYAVELFDKTTMTARESLMTSLGGLLATHVGPFEQHNPELIDVPLPAIFQAVVEALSSRGLLVLMSNHVSKAGWCCSDTDGNGWFNDIHFNVPKWLSSLSSMASLLSQYPNVVAFDLRNELRTNTRSRATQISDWMKYIPQGINALHSVNSDALIFVSGLNYDLDLAFLDEGRNTQEWNNINARLRNKIVFEGHIYSWSGFGAITEDCNEVLLNLDKKLGWPKRNNQPLVITEFGLDVNSFPDDVSSLQYFNCVKRFIVEKKLGYAVWTLGGSYYFRDGSVNQNEGFGMLDSQWSGFKKNSIYARACKAMDWTASDDSNAGTTLETWTGIGGLTIADLRSGTNNLANTPTKSVRLTNLLEGPTNAGDNYGSRMKGWLMPPVTGDYVFWIASDDNGEFWLSTNDEKLNMVRVCHVPGWTNSREWTKYPEQRSMPIWLVAGQSYYYEALMKDWSSGDNLAIAWQYPGQILEVIPARGSKVMGPTPSVNVFCYGDSLTWGHDEQTYNFSPPRPNPYAKYLEQEIANRLQPAALVRHIGLSGWTSSQMLDKFNDETVGLCPAIRGNPTLSVVVILVGTNDLWGIEHEASPEDRAAAIAQSIADLHTRALTGCGNATLHTLSIGIPESRYQVETPVARRMASLINTALSEFSSSPESRISYIEFPFPFQENDVKWHSDGIHMSGEGYKFLGRALADPVMKILDSSRGDEKSVWKCYRQIDSLFVGQVEIWWGHKVGDGIWACNSWRSECGTSQGGGGCTAVLLKTTYSGGLLETWTGIGGLTIADLRSGTNNLANTPTKSVRLTNLLEGPTNAGDNYGSRMKGWLMPPVTGDYVFWIASDDNGEFWLSTNDEKLNMVRVCHVPGWTNRREWTKYPEQRSMPIWLVAGQSYYYEALMKDWGSGDNLAIAWQYPGQMLEVIPASLSSRFPNPTLPPISLPTNNPTHNPTSQKPTRKPTLKPTGGAATSKPTSRKPTMTRKPTTRPITSKLTPTRILTKKPSN